jgi:hypothetical protein
MSGGRVGLGVAQGLRLRDRLANPAPVVSILSST